MISGCSSIDSPVGLCSSRVRGLILDMYWAKKVHSLINRYAFALALSVWYEYVWWLFEAHFCIVTYDGRLFTILMKKESLYMVKNRIDNHLVREITLSLTQVHSR